MFKHLAKKTALVTGSTSGIGLAVARRFAMHGCNVVLNGFGDASKIESTRIEIEKQYKVQVQYSGANLKSREEIFTMIKDANKVFGGVDILVNNAGIQHIAPAEDFDVIIVIIIIITIICGEGQCVVLFDSIFFPFVCFKQNSKHSYIHTKLSS
jgi:NAD(P)-dependent dehydrogenase (short-subunit alcohol dehydrogenase family)